MINDLVPGTVVEYNEDSAFERFKDMIEIADGLTLSQVCTVTGLEPSTVQNWVKRGFVARPVGKKYYSRQFARILLISALRDSMKIERIGELLTMVNGNAESTEDDIISEEQLYDYLCNTFKCLDVRVVNRDEISDVVKRTIDGYVGPDKGAKARLEKALFVMVYAYISCRFKQESDLYFSQMLTGEL